MKKSLQTFLLFLLATVVGLPAYAYDSWQDMSVGTPLEFSTPYTKFGGKFTLSQSSMITISVSNSSDFQLFSNCNNLTSSAAILNTKHMTGSGDYKLAAGTYYLYCQSVLAAGSISYDYFSWEEMSEGVDLEYVKGSVGGTFTLAEDKTVDITVTSNNSYGMKDTFELFNSPYSASPLEATSYGAVADTYELPAGTYYLYCNSTMGTGSIRYDFVEPFVAEITSFFPANGSTISATTNDGFLSLDSNFMIYVGSWRILSDTYNSPIQYLDANTQGTQSSISIYVKEVVNSLYEHGLSESDHFQIKLYGIHGPDAIQYGDGTFTVDYYLGPQVLDLLTSHTLDINSKNLLLSYYLPGDPAAQISFTFTDAFDPNAAQIVMPYINNIESAGVTKHGPLLELGCRSTSAAQVLYYEGVYSNDNRTVTFDISGFDFNTWEGALGADGAVPGFKLFNVFDLNGNNALGSDPGSPGAYTFQTDYRQYQQATFNQVWTPAAGSTLTETTSVTITTVLSGSDLTGVKNRIRGFNRIDYFDSNGEVIGTVPFAQCTMNYTNEANGILNISCPTPAAVLSAKNVTVKVLGLITCDNMLYDESAISATFNPAFSDPSSLITFKTIDVNGEVHSSNHITSLSALRVYTDLAWSGEYPNLSCSSGSVTPYISYISYYPSEDSYGRYYEISSIGRNIALTAGNEAVVVADGTTFTISFPEQSFSGNETVYGDISHTWTFTTTPEKPVEEFSINLTTPSGATVNQMADGEFVFAVTGTPEHNVLYYRLYDGGSEVEDAKGQITETATPGVWSAYAKNMIYLNGHTYNIVVKGYEDLDDAEADENYTHIKTFTFSGTGTPATYNHSITATVSPAVGTIQPTQSNFTFTFSAPVKLTNGKILLPKTKNGAQDPIEFTPVATNPDANGCSTVWTIDLTSAGYNMYRFTYLDLVLYGVDAAGNYILTGPELEMNSYFKFTNGDSWYINNGADKVPLVLSAPSFGTVYDLSKIVVTLDGELTLQAANNGNRAYLRAADGAKYYLTSDIINNVSETVDWLVPDGWSVLPYGTYTFVVEQGYYIVEQTEEDPERMNGALQGTFTYEELGNVCVLKPYTSEYYIESSKLIYEGSVWNVYVKVDNATDYKYVNAVGTPSIAEDISVGITPLVQYEGSTAKHVNLQLSYGKYAGDYTMSIPAGYIEAKIDGEWFPCPATEFEISVISSFYSLPTASSDMEQVVPANSGTTKPTQFNEIAITFDGVEYSTPQEGVIRVTFTPSTENKNYDFFAKEYGYGPISWNTYTWNYRDPKPYYDPAYVGNWGGATTPGTPTPAYVFPLPSLVDHGVDKGYCFPGEYTIIVDVGSFIISRPVAASVRHRAAGVVNEKSRKMETTFTIHEDATNSVAVVLGDENGIYEVYNLSGAKVMRTDNKADLDNLAPGFYIINGQKTVIR